MKTTQNSPITATVQRPKKHPKSVQLDLPRGRLEGPKATQSRVQQKAGGYKRVDVLLGVEAAIALRQLMRDGRSAREVIEALLLAEKQRMKEHH
jgi:hypothetical protein